MIKVHASDMREMVNNRNNGRIRCPGCEKTAKVGAFCPWLAPESLALVCCYGVCRKCASEVQNTPPELTKFTLDRIERTLLRWYPFIRDNLPAGYEPKGGGTGNS